MRSYTGAMRTNRPARPTARPAHPTRRPTLAAMFVAATAVAAVTILVTAVVVALACYLAGVSSAKSYGGRSGGRQAAAVSTAPLIDPTVGRGAESATCKHAPRSPRCLREGGTAAVVRDRGAARQDPAGDDQTVLLGGESARPAEVPGRGGWVSELAPSAA